MTEFRCEICDRPMDFPVYLGEISDPAQSLEASKYYDLHLNTHYTELMKEFVELAQKYKPGQRLVKRLKAIESVMTRRKLFTMM